MYMLAESQITMDNAVRCKELPRPLVSEWLGHGEVMVRCALLNKTTARNTLRAPSPGSTSPPANAGGYASAGALRVKRWAEIPVPGPSGTQATGLRRTQLRLWQAL